MCLGQTQGMRLQRLDLKGVSQQLVIFLLKKKANVNFLNMLFSSRHQIHHLGRSIENR